MSRTVQYELFFPEESYEPHPQPTTYKVEKAIIDGNSCGLYTRSGGKLTVLEGEIYTASELKNMGFVKKKDDGLVKWYSAGGVEIKVIIDNIVKDLWRVASIREEKSREETKRELDALFQKGVYHLVRYL